MNPNLTQEDFLPAECTRLRILFLAHNNEAKFLEDVILKNLFSLEKHESATLVLYPTGHIDLKSLPKEMFEATEKILERKSKKNNEKSI